MATADGKSWIAYNGELYNYREIREQLRHEGHVFRSESDTEVLLHAVVQDGVRALRTFNGMFSFALWNSETRELFAARDRMGIKPFYYAYDGETLIFGSEIKAILAHPGVSLEPNIEAIREYIALGFTEGDATWYSGIKKLPPGCYLRFQGGELTIGRYWELVENLDEHRSFDDWVDELRPLLRDAVRLHLRSDVPTGAYLSGGIDSSGIVALASGLTSSPVRTFSGAFAEGSEYDEREYINIVVNRFGTAHDETFPDAHDFRRTFAKLLWHLDEPVVGPGAYSQFAVSRSVAASGVKVVNGGQAGDEMFAGYPYYHAVALRDLSERLSHGRRAPFSAFKDISRNLLRAPRVRNFLNGARSRATPIRIWRTPVFAPQSFTSDSTFTEVTVRDLTGYLPALLHLEDRVSMAWSIESRIPLLDYRVVELSTGMPSWIKMRGGVLKAVLREALRGVVPDVILDRRDKRGFPTPMGLWFRGSLRDWYTEQMLETPLLSEQVLDRDRLEQAFNAHVAGSFDYSTDLWKALNIEFWFRGIASGWVESAENHESERVPRSSLH